MMMKAGRSPHSVLCAHLVLAPALLSSPAWAQEAAHHFQIPRENLADALEAFSQQSGSEILFSRELTRGKTSTAVNGDMEADEALKRLLSNSGLISRRVKANTYVIEAARVERSAGKTGSFSLAGMDMKEALLQIGLHTGTNVRFDPDAVKDREAAPVKSAKTAEQAIVQAIAGTDLAMRREADGSITVFSGDAATATDVVVMARRDQAESNYLVDMASTSTRTGQTLKELAQSTAVVSDQMIRDQQAQSVLEAIQNVAGAVPSLTSGQGLPSFAVRGWGVSGLTNGLSSLSATSEPVANVERIEVLKGPAAVLAGLGNLGGTINVVTKKPVAQALVNGSVEFQNYADKKVTVDVSDALNSSKSLSGRFIAEAESAGHADAGFTGRDEYLYAPSLRFKNAYTDLVVGLDSTRQFTPPTNYTFVDTTTGKLLPHLAQPLAGPDQGAHVRNFRYYYDFSQSIGEWLTLVSRGEHYHFDLRLPYFLPLGSTAAGQYAFFEGQTLQKNAGTSEDSYARIKVSTFGLQQTLLVGLNYSQYETTQFDSIPNFLMLNIFGPNPNIPPQPPLDIPASYVLSLSQNGLYAQDLLEYGRFHFVAAVRHNRYGTRFANPARPSRNNRADKNATIPSYGVVYDVTQDINVYANYMKGYNPTTSLAFDGTTLPDIQTRNIEAGIKADILGRAALVVDGFSLNQNARLVGDPLHPNYSTAIAGGQKERGAEATLTGRVLSTLNVNVTYAYTNYQFENTQQSTLANLRVVTAAPAHVYGFFANYEQRSGLLRGAGAALGVFGSSRSHVDNAGKYSIPGGTRVDTNLYYTWGRAHVNFGIKNLFDRRLYGVSSSPNFVPVQPGRYFIGTLSYSLF